MAPPPVTTSENWTAVISAGRKITSARIERLRHWLDKEQKMLPWIMKFLLS